METKAYSSAAVPKAAGVAPIKGLAGQWQRMQSWQCQIRLTLGPAEGSSVAQEPQKNDLHSRAASSHCIIPVQMLVTGGPGSYHIQDTRTAPVLHPSYNSGRRGDLKALA